MHFTEKDHGTQAKLSESNYSSQALQDLGKPSKLMRVWGVGLRDRTIAWQNEQTPYLHLHTGSAMLTPPSSLDMAQPHSHSPTTVSFSSLPPAGGVMKETDKIRE